MASVTDRTIPGPAGDIPVRVYVPTDEPGPRPVLVYFHGGGWVIGDLDTHDGTVRAIAEGSGATVVSVDYRLAPEDPFPAAIDDCVAAVALGGRQRRRARRRPGRAWRWAATRRAATWPPSSPPSCATTPVDRALPAADLPGHRRHDGAGRPIDANAEGYFLTKDTMDWFWEQYVGAGDRTEPAGVADAPARRGARRAAAGARSSRPSTTRCATRARPTAPASSGPACRSRPAATTA